MGLFVCPGTALERGYRPVASHQAPGLGATASTTDGTSVRDERGAAREDGPTGRFGHTPSLRERLLRCVVTLRRRTKERDQANRELAVVKASKCQPVRPEDT